jgi:hypothetical protein
MVSVVSLMIFFYLVYDLFVNQNGKKEALCGNDYWCVTFINPQLSQKLNAA